MKRIILSHITLIFIFTVYSSALTQATETVTINSYLPGPIANVQTLRLNPHTETTTLGCLEGTTYIDTSGNFKICKDNGAGSTDYYSPSSDWTLSGNYIYPTDTATNSSLRVGIGTSAPKTTLDVNGDIIADRIFVNRIILTTPAPSRASAETISAYSTEPVDEWDTTVPLFPSDQRFKTDVKPLTNALDTIAQLNPVKYHWLDIQKDAAGKVFSKNEVQPKVNFGLLAQDVYKITPEVVIKPVDESKELWRVSYQELIPLLIQAAKEQKSEVEALKTKAEVFKAEVEALKAEVENLKRELTTLKKSP